MAWETFILLHMLAYAFTVPITFLTHGMSHSLSEVHCKTHSKQHFVAHSCVQRQCSAAAAAVALLILLS
jgi:hypothetical protein